MFQVLFGLVLICFIAFAVYHYRQKLPVVQSALSNYHPGLLPKVQKVLSRATLRNTLHLIVTLVTLKVTIFPYREMVFTRAFDREGYQMCYNIIFMLSFIPDCTFDRG